MARHTDGEGGSGCRQPRAHAAETTASGGGVAGAPSPGGLGERSGSG